MGVNCEMINIDDVYKKYKIECMGKISDLIKENGCVIISDKKNEILDVIEKTLENSYEINGVVNNENIQEFIGRLYTGLIDHFNEFSFKIHFTEPNWGDLVIYYRRENKIMDFIKELDLSLFFSQLKEENKHIFPQKKIRELSNEIADIYNPQLLLEVVPEKVFYKNLMKAFHKIHREELLQRQKSLL